MRVWEGGYQLFFLPLREEKIAKEKNAEEKNAELKNANIGQIRIL